MDFPLSFKICFIPFTKFCIMLGWQPNRKIHLNDILWLNLRVFLQLFYDCK